MPFFPFLPSLPSLGFFFFFFFNDTATTEIYTLSLHDALPILSRARAVQDVTVTLRWGFGARLRAVVLQRGNTEPSRLWSARHTLGLAPLDAAETIDRKSTRLNSSH